MKKVLSVGLLFFAALAFGCAGALSVGQISVSPEEVDAGAEAKIMVVFKGPKDKVAKVIVTVRENPDIYYSLNDEGKNGDEKAGDNIWTYVAAVPYDAPPAIYNLDISAYDKENNEIVTEGVSKQSMGKTGTVKVTVN